MPIRDDWKSSQLWEELESRTGADAGAVRVFLERLMPDIARVLTHGASSPPDFTLHDAEHSYRVADWMARLMPDGLLALLSEYEIALLLLSAYLHDVGMTPELGKIRRHRDFLLTGNEGLLTSDEAQRFQYWLDAAEYGVTPPLNRQRPLDETVRQADEIITGYTRHRHNDWSEEWIRARFTGEPMGTYEGWMADLVRLCRSHHEGYEALVRRDFDPRRVGSGAQVVHLRYLAALLRVADVLDVDRERTPVVVFHHRDVATASQPYWKKDAELTIHLENGQISAAARPLRAYLHRAVEETLDGIERELVLCRRLADVRRFEQPVGPGADLPHRWILQSTLFRDVEPRNGAYQYIDGAFRPNTRRLLELLSGMALYGDPLAAIRELLQNAFDAVRELIAYRRLRMPDPANPALEARIGNLLWVRLWMEQEGDHWWLVCRDDGVGMSQEIIRDALLVSGSPPRPEVLELDRRCRAAGFRLVRTGQFGIGALSYFMLAERVMLTTRRANEAGSAEQHGWHFESSGVGSFGELRADGTLPHGTEVRMRLRSNEAADPVQFAARLSLYLRSALIHIPCNLAFEAPIDEATFRRPPGWVLDDAERTGFVLQDFHASGEETGFGSPETASPKLRRQIERQDKRWEAIRREAATGLRWTTDEGELPEGMGRYRLHLPYFELAGGVSLPFIRPRLERGGLVLRPVARDNYQLTSSFTAWGWKGINVDVTTPTHDDDAPSFFRRGLVPVDRLLGFRRPVTAVWEQYGVSAEVDLQSAAVGTLAVSRGWVELGPKGKKLVGWLGRRARKLVETFVTAHLDSRFALLNARMTGVTPPTGSQYEWALSGVWYSGSDARARALHWGALPFPLTLPSVLASLPGLPLVWKGQLLSAAREFRRYGSEWNGHKVAWFAQDTPPQRVVAISAPHGLPVLAPLWTGEPVAAPPAFADGWISEFPTEWRNVCAAFIGETEEVLIWNQGNVIVRAALVAPEKLRKSIQRRTGSWAVSESALETPATAAIWVLDRVASFTNSFRVDEASEAWNEVGSTAPDFLARLWNLLFGASAYANGAWEPITFVLNRWGWRGLVTLTPAGALLDSDLPPPAGPEWVASQSTS